jgi:hypothetical protein
MYKTVAELAAQHRVSKPAIYHWQRTRQIREDSITRVGGVTRIDDEVFARLLAEGKLNKRPGRKCDVPDGQLNQGSHTTRGEGPRTEHRWTYDNSNVMREHPYGTGPLAEVLAELCGELVDPR